MNWKCPFCHHRSTIQSQDQFDFSHTFKPNKHTSEQAIFARLIFCPNEECNKFTFDLTLGVAIKSDHGYLRGIKGTPRKWTLIPESSAKPLPEYIPQPLSEDYYQACLIQNASPKASATLARRCLQGMIRDFWGIAKGRLVDEIDALEHKVDAETWDAIDSVRKIGNIGAHMEKDINVIVDVDPEEAGLMIGLIETLFDEWYVARHERQLRMAKVKAIASQKELELSAAKAIVVAKPSIP